MNSILTKPGVHILILLGAITCFVFFQFFYPYHLFYQEQNQLFLFSWEYILTYLDKPGWLACLTGDFLTQFYYYRYAGPAILTFAILVTGFNVRCSVEVTGVKGSWTPYILALAAMVSIACFSLHYDYKLSSIIAFAGGANVFRSSTQILTTTRRFVKRIESLEEKYNSFQGMGLVHWIAAFSILITVPVCHWLFGNGIWIYAALVLLGCLSHITKPGNYSRLVALIVPFFLLMLCKRIYFVDFYTLYTYPGIGKFVKPETSLEKTLSVDCEYYFGNYNKVVNIVEKEENPTSYMKFYYNLVSAQARSLSSVLLKYPNNNLGTFETLGPNTPTLTIKTLNELYWVLGDMTFCERATLLSCICSPNKRNIRMIKRLAEINIVTGETQAAQKYLTILTKTFVWDGWAKRMLQSLTKHPTDKEVAALQPYLDKRQFINTRDTLRTSDNAYVVLKELVESNPANNLAINYMLCSDLLLKDMEDFKHDYDAYYLRQRNVLYDRLYQEALCIYLTGTHAPLKDWNYYIKRPEVLRQFYQYNQQRGSAAFRDTYWYYFDRAETPKLNK